MSQVYITSGELNRRVALDRFVAVDDEAGQTKRTWVEKAQFWARITTLKFQRSIVAGGVNVELTHAVRIRHRTDVEPDMRLRYGGRTFIVHVVDDVDEAHACLDLFCSEGTRED